MPQPKAFVYRLLAALLLGVSGVCAFAPIGAFPLIWLSLGGLYALLTAEQTLRRGALLGAAFGFGLFIGGVSWIYVSLSVFGGMPMALAALATLLFCLGLSIYPALAAAAFVRFSTATGWQRGLFFAALWTLSEWLRGWVLTGFPWLASGYSQTPPSPLAGFTPVIGVYGLSLLCALIAALGCEVMRNNNARRTRIALLLSIALLLAGGQWLTGHRWTEPLDTSLRVSLLQGNIKQDLKWRPEKFTESLRTYYHLAKRNPAQLTVLPETGIPAFLEQVPAEYLNELKKLAEREQGDLLFGVVIGDGEHYANGAVSVGQSPSQRYRKSHLVPFGEIIPPGFAWFLALADIPMSNFTPGPAKQKPLDIAGQKVAVNICYEDAFGEEIIRALPEATLLVNLSNVAWFGDSLAPAQHLQIAQTRALETGRMMLRSTNTGMTAIIAPDGRVQSALPPFTQAALQGEVRGYQGATPYVLAGNWPTITLTVLLVALFIRRKTLS